MNTLLLYALSRELPNIFLQEESYLVINCKLFFNKESALKTINISGTINVSGGTGNIPSGGTSGGSGSVGIFKI